MCVSAHGQERRCSGSAVRMWRRVQCSRRGVYSRLVERGFSPCRGAPPVAGVCGMASKKEVTESQCRGMLPCHVVTASRASLPKNVFKGCMPLAMSCHMAQGYMA